MAPAKTGKKQAGQFAKGKSGNPNGRPQGSRNAATLALESMLDGQAEALTQKAIDLALAGDLVALRICLDRILPPRKDRPVAFEILPITTIEDAPKVMAAVTAAVAQGGLTVREASALENCRRQVARNDRLKGEIRAEFARTREMFDAIRANLSTFRPA
jgi:Family of unknown function (DUF5681)